MVNLNFYITNTLVKPPLNWMEIAIELNYGKDQFPGANTVTISDLEWVRENYDLLKKYIDDGLTGGAGIMEAPPLRIDLTDSITTKTVFQGYIDLTEGLQVKDRVKFTTKITSHATVDWINQIAGGFTFEYLASTEFKNTGLPGAIDNSYYRFMPYTKSMIPNYEQSAIATLTLFSIEHTIIKAINEIAELTFEVANPFAAASAILKALVKIGYLTLLLVTLLKLSQDIYKFIISPVKYHAGMYVRDLMERACTYLNMGFVSDIWALGSPWYNEFILPEKLYNKEVPNSIISGAGLFGYLTPDKTDQIGWYKGTFAKLLDAMKTKYNAKIVVSVPEGNLSPTNMGTVYLLRRDKNAQPPQYQLPDIYNPDYTYNADELPANTLIEYQLDSTDTNTFQYYQGTIYQVICQPNTVNYRPYVMYKNYIQVQIPFARAITKITLTVPEKIIYELLGDIDFLINGLVVGVNALIAGANAILNLLNSIIKALKTIGIKLNWKISPIPKLKKISLSNLIENRVGMMLLSADHFNVPKIFILKEGSQSKYNKIDPSNDGWDGAYKVQTLDNARQHAQAMWNYFYYVNSFVPKQLNPNYSDRPTGNQYKIQNFTSVPFGWDDFLKVFANNRIFDFQGNSAILESLKFYPPSPGESGKADMRIRFNKLFTLNLHEQVLNPDGK